MVKREIEECLAERHLHKMGIPICHYGRQKLSSYHEMRDIDWKELIKF